MFLLFLLDERYLARYFLAQLELLTSVTFILEFPEFLESYVDFICV